VVSRRFFSPRVAGLLLALPFPLFALAELPGPAGRLRGTVVVEGRPVPGAVASAVPLEDPFDEARRTARGEAAPEALASATAGSDGAFALSVPAGPGRDAPFQLRISAPGAVAALLPAVFDAGETVELGDLPLRKAFPLAGRVAGPDGKPVAGARVTLTARGRFDLAFMMAPVPEEVATGPDGTFRFESAASERNELVVEAAGLAAARVEAARAGALPRPIALAPGATLSGSVKRRDGTPAPGALVRYEADGLATRWVEAGADGTFLLAGLPARRGSVVADGGDEGYAEATSVTAGPGRPPLAIVLAPPTVLEGRTLDVATLKPVPRVRLTVGTDGAARATRSGADGRYRLRGLRPGETNVLADEARHVRWSRARVRLEKGATTTLDVPLTRGASLAGRVVDEDGRPVPDAKLIVSPRAASLFSWVIGEMAGDPAATIRTRGDGAFSTSRLPSGTNQRLTARHPDFEDGTLGGLSLSPGETRSGAVVTLRRGLVLAGTVKDQEGNPIPGAELSLGSSRVVQSSQGATRRGESFGGVSDLPTGRSGADGRFELKGVPPGDWALTVKAAGRATETVDPVRLARHARPDPVEVVLLPGASISGFVFRRTGGGAEGFMVFPRPVGRPPTSSAGLDLGSTGPDGAFLLEGLRAGEAYDLELYGGPTHGVAGRPKKEVPAPSAGIEWTVEGTGRIEGVAIDGRTGRPLEVCEVSFHSDDAGLDLDHLLTMRSALSGPGSPARVDQGAVLRTADGRFAFEEVPAGKWQVIVTAKGYQVGRAAGIGVEEATTTEGVEIRLLPGSVLKGRVTEERSGRGVPEANVVVRGADGAQAPGGGGVTDADGRFEADGLPPGKVFVFARHDDYAPGTGTAELGERGGNVEVALSRGGSLGGVVLSATRQPAPGAEVSLAGSGGGTALTDPSGRFRFERLPPGRYKVRASVPGQSAEPVEAVLVPGEPAPDVTLVLAGGATIRGTVAGLPAGPGVEVKVQASGPRAFWASARTGPDGRFELGGAPPGTITLRASAPDLAAGTTRYARGSVTVAEGQEEAEAEIAFEGGASLSGRITRGGEAFPEARVVLEDVRGESAGSGRSDPSGVYRIEGIAPGTYTASVSASHGMGQRGVRKSVRIDGDTSLDVDLPLARLHGIVVDAATKQPLAYALVGVFPVGEPEGRFVRATTDTNGRFFAEGLEPGTWDLKVRRTGYREALESVVATEAGGDAGTIALTRGEGLELRVNDGVHGIPLRFASVRAFDGSGASVLAIQVPLDGEGRGEVTSLGPGRYTLAVAASGYAARVFEGVVVPGAPLPVALTPGGSVEVRPGEAARGKGEATLRNALGRPHPYRTWGTEGRVALPAFGPVLVENLAPGSYTLAVEGIAPKGFSVTEGGRTLVELP
jgi:protocatechuate 3,4-dioxygenase beta subunit